MTYQGVHDIVRRVAGEWPNAVAIAQGSRQLTYGELDRRVNQLAYTLRAAGLSKGRIVVILASETANVAASMLAILEAGGVFCPLDPTFPERRLVAMAERLDDAWWIAEPRHLEKMASVARMDAARIIVLDGATSNRVAPTGSNDVTEPDDPCSIYFTSGSTGRPKAILGRLSGIDQFVHWEIEALGIGAGTRVSQLASPSFDGFLKDVFVPLCAGGTACAPESRDILLDAARLSAWADAERIEVLQCVPSVFRSLLNHKLEPSYFSALRWVVLAGEPLLPSDVQRWTSVFGDRIPLINLYGPTETTVTKFCYFVQPVDAERPTIPIGKPIPGTTAMVVNSKGQLCRPGTVGEIYIRTPHRALGYYGDPELTSQVFVPNPFTSDPDDIVYRTGDYGRVLNDGNFEFLGRRDQQVKIRGVRVELGEVESLLCGHPEVREAAVVDRTDSSGSNYLCAYVALRNGSGTGILREFLAERLPEFMTPSAFVTLPELPRTLNGKIDRKALPTLKQARDQQTATAESRPRSAVEEIVAGIWSEVLRLPRVGLEENFFELGGHSLLATQIISRVREALSVELPLRALFEAPTAGALAQRIEQERQKGAGLRSEAIPKMSRDGELPLSYAQQRMWFLEQMAEGSAAYHLPLGMRVKGRLQVGLLEQTFGEVVRRHEVLRTSFPAKDGEPRQVIGAVQRLRLPLVDVSRLEEEERGKEAERIAGEQARRSFNLSQGPLVRTLLVRMGVQEHVVLCTMHHLVADAWSFQVLTAELNQLYESFGKGQPSALSELTIQYADYAGWQREWLKGEPLESRLAYWREQLDGAQVRLALPQRKRRPAVLRHAGRRQAVALDAELVKGLRELSRRQGTTLYMTLLSGFAALLHQYTGQDDMVVGSVIANRDRGEVEKLIGFFANTLVLRLNVAGEPSFRELVGRVRETCLGAYAHQLPPEKLVEELGRQDSGLYEAWFQLETASREHLEFGGGLTWERWDVRRPDNVFELGLVLYEYEEQVWGEMEYDPDLFEDETIAQMVQGFDGTLRNMVSKPECGLSKQFSSAGHAAQLNRGFVENLPAAKDRGAKHRGVHDLFSEVATQFASEVAIDRVDRRITYAQLETRSNQVANALLRRGAGKGALVAIIAGDPIEVTTALLGVLKAGCVFVPLDPGFPLKRLEIMIAQAEPAYYVVEPKYIEKLAHLLVKPGARLIQLDELELEDDTKSPVTRSGDDGCSIYFTSGSTGRPKAILGRLSGIDHFVSWEMQTLGIESGTRVSQLASPSFDGFLKDVFVPLCAGGTACAPKSRDIILDAARLAAWVDGERIEVLHCVPAVFRSLLNQRLEPSLFSALKWVVLAGEPLLPSDVQRWTKVFGDRVRLVNLYGPTETTVTKFCYFVQPEDAERPTIPIGKPIRNAAAAVVDRGGQPCGAGDVGEIYIRTPHRALGYYGDPELTSQVFVQNPFTSDPDDIVYRTGDYGRILNDGNFEFLGRRDQQVKIRGVRVELGEVESLLCDHPEVREAAVVDRTDASGSNYLCAYVALRNGSGTGILREYLAERLPEFMTPSAFVTLSELPRTLNGKIDRKALPTLEQARDQQTTAAETRPRSAVEEIVAGIWSEVLRLPRVGLEENFFELGGHSLLATQIISRVREALSVELPLRALFEAPTAGALAQRIEQERQKGAGIPSEAIPKMTREGELPLSYAQQRMWFLEQMAEGSAAYHLPLGMRVKGRLQVGLLEQTFGEVVRRHEVLRTSFPAKDGEPRQVIGAAERLRLPLVDVSRLEEEERGKEAERIAGEQARRSFNLSQGPLVRTLLVRMGVREHVVLCTMHHLVADAWSFQVLTAELNQLYESYGKGQPSALSELTIQYADYAGWQREWLKGEPLESRLAYWRQQMEGAQVRLALPQRKRRPAVQRHAGRRQPVGLDAELVKGLRELSRRQGTTLYMTLLSGFAALLYQYTGQDDLVVGSVIANRDRAEVEKLIGFFANTLVLRLNVAGEPSFRELVGRVRETCLGAYAHQLPPEKLVEELGRQDSGLYEAWFQLETASREQLQFGGELTWERWEVHRPTNVFELAMVLYEHEEQISGEMEYDPDLYEHETIVQLLRGFDGVLRNMISKPDAAVSKLHVPAERLADLSRDFMVDLHV